MDLSGYHDLRYYSTWKECSYDSAADESMVDSDEKIINFDRVKTRYMNSLGKSEECAASVDAVGEDVQGKVYFIEFKNGAIDDDNIRNKITESLLIYHDITHRTIQDTRKNTEFILVFNPDKIRLRPLERRAMNLARLSNVPCHLHGLDRFYGTWVRRAYMMPAKEFMDKMVSKISV